MRLKQSLWAGLVVVALLATKTAVVGCGEASERAKPEVQRTPQRDLTEYAEVLGEFQVAASAGETYDAYGIAEYFPSTQRAAVDAFCFIADQLQENPGVESLEDPSLAARITRKAEVDLKAERDIIAPRPTRRAIGKLRAILGLESLNRDQAEDYVRACYH